MLKKYRKFAPIGLIVGLIASIIALFLRVSVGQVTLLVRIGIIISVLGLAAFIILDPDMLLQTFTGRRAKYGSNALVLILGVIGILVIINLYIFNNNVSWDLTEDNVNTLAPESLAVLSNISAQVSAKAFYSPNISSENAQRLLQNVERNSNGLFSYEFIDPYQDPITATQAEIDRDGTVVLTALGQTERLTFLNEENLINALIKLQNPIQTSILVLTGHGESNFFDASEFAMTELRRAIELKNYQVNSLNLVANPTIPENTKVIIISAPQIPLDENEVLLISDYLSAGGSLVLFSEPPFLTRIEDQREPLSEFLLDEWGIVLGNDLIIDLSLDPAEIAIADQYGQHPITEKVGSYITFFPTSRSITIMEMEDVLSTNLVFTSNQTWAETNIEGILNNEAGFDDSDILGPITVAVASENFNTGARVVVVGDSDFATNAYINAYGNLDLAMGMIDWAAELEQLINLTPPQRTSRILVPPTRATQLGIILGGVVGLPLFITITGIIIAVQRKRTG